MAPSPDPSSATDAAPVPSDESGSSVHPRRIDEPQVHETAAHEGTDAAPGAAADGAAEADGGFRVTLDVFDGPFDLLLTLISKRELDITEVSLSEVTNEFIAHVRALGPEHDLDESSQFLVVAATLLDMKVAGLLPQGELVDAESVALLEARDLLFARLLQYRAFKEVSAWFGRSLVREDTRHARTVRRDAKYRDAVPELVWTLSPQDFAALAMLAFAPKEIPQVGLDHLHAPLVSIREQAAVVVTLLRNSGSLNFRELIVGVDQPGIVVARFLSVLELRWTASRWSDENLATLGADYDR